MKKTFIFSLLALLICGVLYAAAFAATENKSSPSGVRIPPLLYPEGAPTVSGETSSDKLDFETVDEARRKLTIRFVDVMLGIAGIVAIYFIVTNGWWLVASAGSEEKITQRKKGLLWAIVGLILIMLSYSIIRFIITLPWSANEPEAQAHSTSSGQASPQEQKQAAAKAG